MKVAESLSRLVEDLEYGDLSTEVIDRTKYLALDFVGLAARGNDYESSKPIHKFINSFGGNGNGTVIGNNVFNSLPQYAALANGSASHSLELDDVINEASLHPAVVVFATAFAVAESIGESGEEFILASVVGYEVMGKLGKALKPSDLYNNGFHPTGVVGIFAAVATASKLMGLTKEETTNAFGIAGSQAAASMEFLSTGSWTKRLHPGWASHNGIIAAELAKEGFTGPNSIIEGVNGFANTYSNGIDINNIDCTYSNQDNFILRTSIKPHACCRYKHGPLDLILEIVKEHDLNPVDINEVTIHLVQTAMPIIAEPIKAKRNPTSSVDAQFSMHFGAAIAIMYQKTLLEQYEMDVVENPEIRELMKKITCIRDEKLDKEYPTKWPSKVVMNTTKGIFSKSVDYPKGDPENPLSWEEMIDKFNYVSDKVYDYGEQKDIIKNIRNIEDIKYLEKVTKLFKGGAKA